MRYGAINMLYVRRAYLLVLLILTVSVVAMVACGEESTPVATSEPTAVATPTSASPTPAPPVAPEATAPPVATPAATPTPVATVAPGTTAAPTPVPVAGAQPRGTLEVAIADLGPFSTLLYNQNFRYSVIETRTSNELGFVAEPDGSVLPRLVTRFELDETPEGAIYTFYLQGGVPWHSGLGDWGEFGADDFIFSLQSASQEGSAQSSSGSIRQVFTCADCELTKLDDLTVQLKRSVPTIQILWDIIQYNGGSPGVHSKKHFDARTEEQANQEVVGTGPWEMVDQQTSQFRRFEAVTDHWRHAPDWEEMIFHDIVENSTRLANFEAGLLDTAAFSLEGIQAIKDLDLPGVEFLSIASGAAQQLRLHGGQYYPDAPAHQPQADGTPAQRALGDGASYSEVCDSAAWVSCDRDVNSDEWARAVKVRKAMNLSIDRQKLVNNLAFGEGKPYFHAVFQGYAAEIVKYGLDELVYEYEPERARQLLTEAGYSDGFDIEMFLVPRGPGAVEAAQAVATMWQDVGINTVQSNWLGSAFRPMRVARTALGASSYRNGPSGEPIRLYDLFYTSGSSFNQGFEHPDYEAMVLDALATLDTDERLRKSADIAKWLFHNAMTITLYQEATVWPLGPRIDGWGMAASQAEFGSNWEKVPHRQ